MAERRRLRVWWGDAHVADIEAARPWDLRCRYTPETLDRWPIGTPLLSCSLPVESRPTKATNFFRGVLPEGRHLQAVASRAKITTNDYYGLLARYGRDIAGALVITVDRDEPPNYERGSIVEYDDADLDEEVNSLDDNPLGLHADSELSIAGVQNKLLLVELADGRWGRPVHGYPSTHILKIDDDRFPGLVRAEGECLALAHAIGLARKGPRFEQRGGADCLIVERYDRMVVDGAVRRSHQEDACQALDVNIDAHHGRGKYESFGGPALEQVARLLRTHAPRPEYELARLLEMVTFTVAIGNADLHGKNLSLLHDQDGYVSLAPAYDTVPTMLWPKLRASSAVSVDGRTDFAAITLVRLTAEANAWGLSTQRAGEVATETLEAIVEAVPSTINSADLAMVVDTRARALLV